jgi:N-acetylmuramoyl-L-alanine amidase
MVRGLSGGLLSRLRAFAPFGLIAAIASFPAAGRAATQLQDLQFHATGSGGTLQLKLSAPVRAQARPGPGSRHWSIDLPATRRAATLHLPPTAGPLQAIAVRPLRGGGLRVALTLAEGTSLRTRAPGTASSQPGFELRSTKAPERTAVASAPSAAPGETRLVTADNDARSHAVITVAHAPRDQGRDIVVAIDAGHGGEDPGASGPDGTQEKTITLAIARQLAARLERERGVHALLTRPDDRFVELRDRAARARKAGADLFVSIHADSVRDRDVEGASVYVLSEHGASSEAARLLADRENAADLRGVPLAGRSHELASVLMDLSQAAAVGNSAEAAGNVLGALHEVGAVRKRVVQYAGFMVLKSPDMPSMLVETAYISNPGEERKLRDAAWQSRLADAIAAGVMKYFRAHPPDGTRVAREWREADATPPQLARNP